MGRPVMLTLEDKDMKGFTWAIAPALTSLGYLLILLVSIFPFWVRLVNEESHEVFFSGLFENCFHIKCWKPRPLSGSAGLCPLSRVRCPAAAQPPLPHSVHHSRPRFPAVRSCPVFPHHLHPGVLCISAVSEDPEAQFGVSLHQLPHRLAKALPWEAPITWRRWNAHSGKIRLNCTQSITPRGPRLESANGTGTEGASAFLALLLHALEIQNLRMKPSPPKFSVQWPYYVLGFAILLFIVAGAICLFQEAACLRCRLLPNSQSIQETQGVIHLENMESLGGDLSSIQKETLLKEETII
ncbi:transmembrane protein 225B isoform X2 [Panthera pardus]|uniref:Transmembrane protein 225B isoform X2 n=1 Tax=Panthera pardus TaxID=9691 RepID=A0A9V1EBR7_PANPR|nr:transmembrane protein 225B isoform X2 [Panthera pardus]